MIKVQNNIVDDLIPKIRFACDLSICKGACCTLAGGTGAPLLDEELDELEKVLLIVKPYLPKEHLSTIEQFGIYEGTAGSHTTMCYNNRACVFVFYENGIAKCSIEKAFYEGKLLWKKPLSCHLFPIRIDRDDTIRLRYERIDECKPALERGNLNQISLGEFLKEPLERAFGSSWYKEFRLTYEWEQNNPHSV